ncbi:MAG: translation elongation factor Ts [Holosporales bacterium]|jgi:elongation factor Ts|nr:translation elongation factor Ts [Holosporales bacterium]
MMEINAKLVKELRDKTGAGMMDCKRALIENEGDLEKAAECLRKKGLMDAAKKSSRTAADGLIVLSLTPDHKTGSIIELNSETDFVAKNEKFQALASKIADVALEINNTEEIAKSMKNEIDSLISLVGENMTLRRSEKISVDNGVISAYVHNAVSENMGKIGVLVALESSSKDIEKLRDFGKKIAMHIAAANPSYLCSKCIPQSVIDKERSIILDQAKEIGKPSDIAEKMADGRIKKFYEEIVLLEQPFVMDNKTKVKDVVENFGKEIGSDVKLVSFVKYILGEGIERATSNFAEEVMSFVK